MGKCQVGGNVSKDRYRMSSTEGESGRVKTARIPSSVGRKQVDQGTRSGQEGELGSENSTAAPSFGPKKSQAGFMKVVSPFQGSGFLLLSPS